MTLNSIVTRAAAAGTLALGAGLFAMEPGSLGGSAEAQAEFIPDTRPPGEFIPNTTPPGEFFLTGGTGPRTLPDPIIAETEPPALGLPAEGVAEAPGEAPIPTIPTAITPVPAVAGPVEAPTTPLPIQTDTPQTEVAGLAIAPTEEAMTPVPGGSRAPSVTRTVPQTLPTPIQDDDVAVTVPSLLDPVIAGAQPDALIVPATLTDDAAEDMLEEAPQEFSAFGMPCGITVTASAMPAAMVGLDIMAPCRPEAAVAITHAGMTLETQLDALGLLTLDVPAFETPAFFTVRFADGTEEPVLVGLPDIYDFDRIALMWAGDLGLELHAMEFGAAWGEAGHVWSEVPASAEAALSGSGGFLHVLETAGTSVQVYTLPHAAMRNGESVALSIDAPITAENCTTNVTAQIMRIQGGGPLLAQELSFTMPSCDAVGEYLVLQNLLDDLRLASNN